MVHLRKLATGHLAKRDSGRLAKCQACDECSFCSDGMSDCTGDEPGCPDSTCCTPSRYRVTFSGVTACSSCIDCGLGGSVDNIVLPTINTSHTLLQDASDACKWSASIGNMTWDEHLTDDCSGGLPSSQSQAMQIDLTKTASNNWILRVWSGTSTHVIFEDTVIAGATADVCDETLSATNGLSCDCDIAIGFPQFVHLSDSGTATLVPCP